MEDIVSKIDLSQYVGRKGVETEHIVVSPVDMSSSIYRGRGVNLGFYLFTSQQKIYPSNSSVKKRLQFLDCVSKATCLCCQSSINAGSGKSAFVSYTSIYTMEVQEVLCLPENVCALKTMECFRTGLTEHWQNMGNEN